MPRLQEWAGVSVRLGGNCGFAERAKKSAPRSPSSPVAAPGNGCEGRAVTKVATWLPRSCKEGAMRYTAEYEWLGTDIAGLLREKL
jgi:hypothetical protein